MMVHQTTLLTLPYIRQWFQQVPQSLHFLPLLLYSLPCWGCSCIVFARGSLITTRQFALKMIACVKLRLSITVITCVVCYPFAHFERTEVCC